MEKKTYVRRRKGKLSDHVEHNNDDWYKASKRKLKASMRHKIKRTFVPVLDALDEERKSGNITEEMYKRMRSCALNAGNDQIRKMEIELDERYNVEALNYHIQFRVMQPEEHENAG